MIWTLYVPFFTKWDLVELRVRENWWGNVQKEKIEEEVMMNIRERVRGKRWSYLRLHLSVIKIETNNINKSFSDNL